MHSAGIVLRGVLSQDEWLWFLRHVAKAIGMEAVGEPAIWTYPVGGKGGTGQTFVLPITNWPEPMLRVGTFSMRSASTSVLVTSFSMSYRGTFSASS